jgi:hypothetical protein
MKEPAWATPLQAGRLSYHFVWEVEGRAAEKSTLHANDLPPRMTAVSRTHCERESKSAIAFLVLGGLKMDESMEEKIARLEAENRALKGRRSGNLSLKISEKGGVSVYGLGRFPVTLYKEQWSKLLAFAGEIDAFIKENDHLLKTKEQ